MEVMASDVLFQRGRVGQRTVVQEGVSVRVAPRFFASSSQLFGKLQFGDHAPISLQLFLDPSYSF
jgi:hypothetical protein